MEKNSWKTGESQEKLENIKEVFKEQGFDLDEMDDQQISRLGFHTGFIKTEDGEIEYTKPLLNAQFRPDSELLEDKLSIQAVEIPKRRTQARNVGHKTIAVCSDLHLGFRKAEAIHDQRAIDAFLQILNYSNPDYLINLGDLIDFADISHFAPDSNDFANTLQPTLQEAHNILALQTDATPNAERRIVLEGNHDCFDADTEVLTSNGWKKYTEIQGLDIASYNIDDGIIEFDPPMAIHEYDFDGELNHIYSGGLDLMITDNHRLVYKPNYSSKSYKIETLSDINLGNAKRILPVSGNNNNPDYNISDDYISLIAWAITDCYIHPQYNNAEFTQRISNSHKIEDLLNSLNIDYRKNTRDRKPEYIMGKKLKSTEPSVEFHLRSVDTKSLKDILGTENYHDIPKYVNQFSKRQFDLFLDTVVEADGTKKSNSLIVYKSKEFLDSLQSLCIQNGYRANIHEYRPGHFRLNISRQSSREYIPANNSHKKSYSGKIWCVTTKNDTVVVRRNGRPVITGNSRLQKKLLNDASQFHGIKAVGDEYPAMSLPNLLKLDKIGHEYIGGYPANEYQYREDLIFIHGSGGGANPTKKLQEKYPNENVVQGHLHRINSEMHTRRDGRYIGKYIMGLMGKIDGSLPSVNNGIDSTGKSVKKYEQWQQGAMIINDYGDGNYEFNQIPINEGKAYWQGKRFEGKES